MMSRVWCCREELEGLQRLRPLEIKKKLRALGVAPEDHPE